jgi:hypothetical protein
MPVLLEVPVVITTACWGAMTYAILTACATGVQKVRVRDAATGVGFDLKRRPWQPPPQARATGLGALPQPTAPYLATVLCATGRAGPCVVRAFTRGGLPACKTSTPRRSATPLHARCVSLRRAAPTLQTHVAAGHCTAPGPDAPAERLKTVMTSRGRTGTRPSRMADDLLSTYRRLEVTEEELHTCQHVLVHTQKLVADLQADNDALRSQLQAACAHSPVRGCFLGGEAAAPAR